MIMVPTILFILYWHRADRMECGGLLPRKREGKPSHSKKNMAGMKINAFCSGFRPAPE